MALVIRNGMLVTMTERGSFRGDLLIAGGRILKIAEKLESLEGFEAEELDAGGLTILPGLVDICIRDGGAEPAWIAEKVLDAGVTTAILLPETGMRCIVLNHGGVSRQILFIRPERLSEDQLADVLSRDSNHRGCICSIRSEKQLNRVAECNTCMTGLVLSGLNGCEKRIQMIADMGCATVIGMSRNEACSPWRLAAELSDCGVPVALSSFYPVTGMKLLPVCAGLCVRDGLGVERALKSITSVPASIIGMPDRGVLQEGCQADLTIFDGNPLLLATSHVMTIAGGRIHRRR